MRLNQHANKSAFIKMKLFLNCCVYNDNQSTLSDH